MIKHLRMVRAKCICGKERIVELNKLKRGTSKGCGCDKRSFIEDYINKKVNRLTILEDMGTQGIKRRKSIVRCLCECGKETFCRFDSVIGGLTKSCGCLTVETNSTHGLSKHPLFRIWNGMKQRCSNKNLASYKDYGGRGVVVCNEWKDDFMCFYNWALSNGWEPGLEIDKDILSPDKTGSIYCHEFCCFVTSAVNSLHKSNSRVIEYNGESLCMKALSDKYNVSYGLLWTRLKLGWDIERAISEPLDKRYSNTLREEWRKNKVA